MWDDYSHIIFSSATVRTYTITLLLGIIPIWILWRVTDWDDRKHLRRLLRSLGLAVISAPGIFYGHGVFVVPAVWFLIGAFFSQRLDLLLYSLYSIIPTWMVIYGISWAMRNEKEPT